MRPKPRVFDWERREIVPPGAVDGEPLGSGNHSIISIQDSAYDERQLLRGLLLKPDLRNQTWGKVPAMIEAIEQATPKGMYIRPADRPDKW